MAVVMDGAIAADAGIITGGAEVVATTMVGGIIAITGDLTSISSERPLSWRPLSCRVAQVFMRTRRKANSEDTANAAFRRPRRVGQPHAGFHFTAKK
jgi:hypothetical protein